MKNKNIKKEIEKIEKEYLTLERNINGDIKSRIEAKINELKYVKKTDLDKINLLCDEIKNYEDILNNNKLALDENLNNKKVSILKKYIYSFLDNVEKRNNALQDKISSYENEFNLIKDSIKSSDLDKLNNLIEMSNYLKKLKKLKDENISLNILINESLKIDTYEQLLDNVINIEEKSKEFNLISKYKVLENDKYNNEIINKKIDDIKNIIDVEKDNINYNELLDKTNNILSEVEKIEDKNKKEEFSEEIRVIKFLLKYYEYIKLNTNSLELKEKKDLLYNKVNELINAYTNLNIKNQDKYIKGVNGAVISFNSLVQELYQQDMYLNNIKDKYSLFTKYSEFVAGSLFNKITTSKLYRKILNKKFEKASEQNDNEKMNIISQKIGDIAIINDSKLFVYRNKLSSLKTKLYKTDSFKEISNKKRKRYINRYEKAVNYISNKMSNKLSNYSNDDEMCNNKNTVTNIILQYIDIISISEEYNTIAQEAKDFIEKSFSNSIISWSECVAYKQEIENIKQYRNDYSCAPYEININEINDIVKYCDMSPFSNKVLYLKNKKNID